MTFTFCTSGAIVIKAGANASSTAITSAAILEQFSNEAEGEIIVATRKDWINGFSTLSSGAQWILQEAASCLGGYKLVNYDMDSIGRSTAESRVNVLRDTYLRDFQLLKEIKQQTFMEK